MASSGRIIAIICIIIMIIACILYIVSNAVPLWGSGTIEISESGVTLTAESAFGLWRTCLTTFGIKFCENNRLACSNVPSGGLPLCQKMIVSRTFVTLACIISGLSALCLIMYVGTHADSNRIIMFISKILPLISFIFGLIGMAVGIAFVTDSQLKQKVDAAAIVAIVAVVINAIGAIFALIIR